MREELYVKQENIWNTDKHRTALGVCTNSLVLASSAKRRKYVKAPVTREWVPIPDAINASGKFITPLITSKVGTFRQTSLLRTNPTGNPLH